MSKRTFVLHQDASCWPNPRDGVVLLATRVEELFLEVQVDPLMTQVMVSRRHPAGVMVEAHVFNVPPGAMNGPAGPEVVAFWGAQMAGDDVLATMQMFEIFLDPKSQEVEDGANRALIQVLSDRAGVFMARRIPFRREDGMPPLKVGSAQVDDFVALAIRE